MRASLWIGRAGMTRVPHPGILSVTMRSVQRLPVLLAAVGMLLHPPGGGLVAQDPPRASATGTVVVAGPDAVPLEGATVSVVDTRIRTVTDARGRFVLGDVPSGTITLRVEHPGFGTLVEEASADPMEILRLRLELTPLAMMLREIRTIADAGEGREEDEDGGTDVPIASDDGSRTAADLLESRIPGLKVRRDGAAGGGGRILIRGVSSVTLSNEPAIYVDGMQIGVGGGRTLQILEDIPADDVVRIRVLKGPSAPPAYARSANGVILIETRRGPGG